MSAADVWLWSLGLGSIAAVWSCLFGRSRNSLLSSLQSRTYSYALQGFVVLACLYTLPIAAVWFIARAV